MTMRQPSSEFPYGGRLVGANVVDFAVRSRVGSLTDGRASALPARDRQRGGLMRDDLAIMAVHAGYARGRTMRKTEEGTMRKISWLAAVIVMVGWVASAQALTDEQKCFAGRAKAKGAYEQCVQKVFRKMPGVAYLDGENFGKLTKCADKYAAVWTKLQALTDSTSCGGQDRFADNGTTVTDRLTLLTWEKKSGDPDDVMNLLGDARDPDNAYSQTWDNDDDGTAYSDFLEKLNTSTGFDNANSWRLPTLADLLTIRNRPEIGPGPGGFGWYWSTSVDQANLGQAWRVHFTDTVAMPVPKSAYNKVRAVRGGL